MSVAPHGKTRDGTGKLAWLGPLSLCLGLVSLVIPVLGTAIAVAAIVCGAIVIIRLRGQRGDWMATTGACAGAIQVVVSVFLLLAS